jgi:hypothetical protein
VAFYPDLIGKANSFAAPIQSQPRFYGKAVRSARFAFALGPHALVLFVVDLSLGFDIGVPQ